MSALPPVVILAVPYQWGVLRARDLKQAFPGHPFPVHGFDVEAIRGRVHTHFELIGNPKLSFLVSVRLLQALEAAALHGCSWAHYRSPEHIPSLETFTTSET